MSASMLCNNSQDINDLMVSYAVIIRDYGYLHLRGNLWNVFLLSFYMQSSGYKCLLLIYCRNLQTVNVYFAWMH